MALGPRHLGKPSSFGGTQEGSYDEWRFQLVAYLTAVDPRLGDVADDVARRTTSYSPTDLPPDEEGRKAFLMLYSIIVGCMKNTPLRLIMETTSRDGREALRKLVAESRPTYRGRQTALLQRIMHSHLNSAGSDAECIDKLSEWQQVVREYERTSGEELDQTDGGSAAADAGTSSVASRSDPGCRGLRALDENLGFWAQSTRAKVSPKERARARAKVRATRAKHSPKGKGKGKIHEPKNNQNSKSDGKCCVLRQDWIFCQRL